MKASDEIVGNSLTTLRLKRDCPPTWWEWNLGIGHLEIGGGWPLSQSEGSDAAEAHGGEWAAWVHPDDLPHLQSAIQDCRDQGTPTWSCDHRVRNEDGSWRRVLNSGKVTARNQEGRAVEMLGVLQDIGALVEADEARLRDAQLLANVKQSIVCTDLEGIVFYWNRGATELYGWTAFEMMGRPFYERMPTEAMREQARVRMRTAAEQGEFRQQREDFRKDGTRIFVESHVFAFRDSTGRVIGVIGTAQDITARRQAELDRLQLERQLLQAQKLETVGRLAAGMAHEFNNILTVIIGNADLALLEEPINPLQQPLLNNVLQAAFQASELVARVQTFSRSQEPVRNPVRLEETVAQAVALIRATLPATIEFRFASSAPGAVVLANANQIQQVLLNLATNAAYAMRGQRGRLTVRLEVVTYAEPKECALGTLPAGDFAVVEISDTGAGIPPDKLGQIFDPYFTTKPVGEGSGLGLAIAHGIMTGHQGGITVATALGSGTTFALYFPLAAPGAGASAQAPGRGERPGAPRSKGETVVVVEDDDQVARSAARGLRSTGYAVRRFSGAIEFYRTLVQNPFPVDLLLTDQTMPRLTGLELARMLRAEGLMFPIIIMSGDASELHSDALRPLAPIEFFRKPFDLARLTCTVDALLTAARDRMAPAGANIAAAVYMI